MSLHFEIPHALRRAVVALMLGALSACLFGSGPLVVRVEADGARINGEFYDELQLDQGLEQAFHGGGVRHVILEAGPAVSADYLAGLMDRIHRVSRAAGLEGDCTVEARALPGDPATATPAASREN